MLNIEETCKKDFKGSISYPALSQSEIIEFIKSLQGTKISIIDVNNPILSGTFFAVDNDRCFITEEITGGFDSIFDRTEYYISIFDLNGFGKEDIINIHKKEQLKDLDKKQHLYQLKMGSSGFIDLQLDYLTTLNKKDRENYDWKSSLSYITKINSSNLFNTLLSYIYEQLDNTK